VVGGGFVSVASENHSKLTLVARVEFESTYREASTSVVDAGRFYGPLSQKAPEFIPGMNGVENLLIIVYSRSMER